MAIEKPLNLSQLSAPNENPMEATTEPYEVTEYDNGDLEFDFSEEEDSGVSLREVGGHLENLIETASDEDNKDIQKIAGSVVEGFEGDKQSRSGWLDTVKQGMSILGTRVEEATFPFPGACGAHHPLILEAAVKFQAKATSELFSSKGPVKTAVLGKTDDAKDAQALRVKNHMNYQVMHQMEEYFDETEMLLFYLPIVGSAFKKTYYDALLDRPVSLFVPVDQFVANYFTTNLKTAPRYTHVITRTHNDLLKDIQAGLYTDNDFIRSTQATRSEYGEINEAVDDLQGFHALPDDEVHSLLEQYVFLDVPFDPLRDPDGIGLPYVVTLDMESERILSIRRNWNPDDSLKKPICPFTHYKFVPGMGFYGLGYIHLLGNLQMTLTSAMRSLIDSGTFANLQGGFVDKRLRIRNNDGPIAPGEYKEVEAGGINLKDSIMMLPAKEPSQTMLAMYSAVEARSQKFADSAEQVIADSTNYGPVGTTIALLEASSKFFSGIHKRLHQAQKNEFKILADINFEYLGDSETFDTVGASFEVSKADYDGRVDIIPVSDPNSGSQAQKMVTAQAVYTAALQNQTIHDMREVTKYYYNSIGVDESIVKKFIPDPEGPQELDPISDLIMAQQGKPIKAFPGQDHDGHVQVKQAFLNDPMSGGNPAMMALAPVITTNIQEHLMLKFKESIAGQAASTPQGPEGTPEGFIVAQAAQKIAQTNQQMQQLQAQSPDAARDKLATAEVMRVTNEGRKLELEMAKEVSDNNFEAMKLSLDKYKTDTQYAIAQMQMATQEQTNQMKEMMSLVKDSMQIKATQSSQEKSQEKSQESNLLKVDKTLGLKQEKIPKQP